MASFWEELKPFGPGLLEQAGTLYGQSREAQAREKLLRRAQGPLYDTQQQMAGQSLGLARGTDPKAMAAERFASQQALVAPGNERDMQRLMAELQRKGMLGLSSFAPVPGTVATPGQGMNPHVAALLAAQQGAKERSAFDSLREGEQYLDQLVRRGGALQGQAQGARSAGQLAMERGQIAGRKPNITDQLLRGGMKLLGNKQAQDSIWSLLKKVPGMFSFGGASSYEPDYGIPFGSPGSLFE